MNSQLLLEVTHLVKSFPVSKGFFARRSLFLKAVDDVSFVLEDGETLSLVGESGCGKTTIARLILGLEKPDNGTVVFMGKDIFKLQGAETEGFRRQVQIIFQDPFSSLNPRKKIISIIGEPLRIHRVVATKEIKEKVAELMTLVGLQQSHINRYPHEFSSGQRQRIGIARALSLNPRIIVADEPVSALDVSIQAQIINLLRDLQQRMNLTYLFISHDLNIVRHISKRIAVMYLGKIVETGLSEELYTQPLHPYTEALLSAAPVPDPTRSKQRIVLEGDMPSPLNPPKGCIFSSRCPIMDPTVCLKRHPALEEKLQAHWASCYLR